MLTLRLITPADIIAIAAWPTYPARFSDLDYALRTHGWLDEYYGRDDTHCYAIQNGHELIGFVILIETAHDSAEIRIALHPEQLGKGYGDVAMKAALAEGFSGLGLSRLHLIVRKNNHPAFALYDRLGFTISGECEKEVNGKTIAFHEMELLSRIFESGEKLR